MTDTSADYSYKNEPAVLNSEAKAALNELGRDKSPGVDEIRRELCQATSSESVKILTKKMLTNMENKTMAY